MTITEAAPPEDRTACDRCGDDRYPQDLRVCDGEAVCLECHPRVCPDPDECFAPL